MWNILILEATISIPLFNSNWWNIKKLTFSLNTENFFVKIKITQKNNYEEIGMAHSSYK